MHDRIKRYVDDLFRSAGNTPKNLELHQEILQNALDRYDDLVAGGMEPETAYRQAISSIGSIAHLIEKPPARRRKKYLGLWIALGCAAALFVLVIPVIALLSGFSAGSPYRDDDSFFDRAEDMLEDAGDRLEKQMDDALQWSETIVVDMDYDDVRAYTEGALQADAQRVREISIQWPVGQVRVEYHSGTEIAASESGSDLPMQWKLDEGELDIRFCKPGRSIRTDEKTLTLYLPEDYSPQELEIETVSADVEIAALSLWYLHCETTSGALQLSGQVDQAELETVSGQFALTLTETPDNLEFESTSGDLALTVPGDRSFTAAMSSVSGELESQWEMTKEGRSWHYSSETVDPAARFEFETVSGSVDIIKP